MKDMKTTQATHSKSKAEIANMIDRCLAIEEEYDNLDNIHLGSEDDEDDKYQDRLELQWHKEELEEEYRTLNEKLGYTKRVLSIKKLRRVK